MLIVIGKDAILIPLDKRRYQTQRGSGPSPGMFHCFDPSSSHNFHKKSDLCDSGTKCKCKQHLASRLGASRHPWQMGREKAWPEKAD